eukprot:SM000055S18228  [mRNA]  locus=s55:158944:161701:- [translate_table: standard]
MVAADMPCDAPGFLRQFTPAVNDTASCPLPGGPHRRLLEAGDGGGGGAAGGGGDGPWLALLAALAATLLVSVPLGLLYLAVLRAYARAFAYATIAVLICLPAALGLYTFLVLEATAQLTGGARAFVGAFLLVVALAWLHILVFRRDKVELAARIFGVASEALGQNKLLLLLGPALQLLLFACVTPLSALLFLAMTVGRLVPHPDRVQIPSLPCGQSTPRPCCVWEVHPLAAVYILVAMAAILWFGALLQHIQAYVTAGAVSQWYFAPAGSATTGTTKKSLEHALGPSLGTLCFSSLVMTIINIVRNMARKGQDDGGNGHVGLFSVIIRCCLECLLQVVEFITGFSGKLVALPIQLIISDCASIPIAKCLLLLLYTVIFAAIRGDDFITSARSTYGMLKRNFLTTVVVDRLSRGILLYSSLLMAGVWGALVYFTHHEVWGIKPVALLAAILSVVVVLMVLSFFTNVIIVAIDATYVCYAMDKDCNTVSKQEIHDVYILVPNASNAPPSLLVPSPQPLSTSQATEMKGAQNA